MPSISRDIQQILTLARGFSPRPTPLMRRRKVLLDDLAANIETALESPQGHSWKTALNLRVQARGQQGSVALVPWVRVFSPRYAPTAQEGVYLTYLFAADGSRAYLSLMHGSSEYRSGSMRAITDSRVLLARAAVARSALGDLVETTSAAGAMLSINLRWQGYSSPDRAKAYENANILAREYEADQIPPDDQLLAEFYDMLPLLARLYDGSPAAQVDQSQAPHELRDGGIPSASSPATGQGSTTDSFLRTMIERCAEDHAFAYFERLGWKVKRVGQFKLGYDLVCMNDDGAVLHVEVKGTRTFGEKVFLTANEVEHVQAAKCEAEHVLYMVSRIQISDDGGARCSDDNVRRFWPWNVGDEDLIPTEYIYTLP